MDTLSLVRLRRENVSHHTVGEHLSSRACQIMESRIISGRLYTLLLPSSPTIFPIVPFTTYELQNQSHDLPKLHKTRQSPDFEALKFLEGPVGTSSLSKLFLSKNPFSC